MTNSIEYNIGYLTKKVSEFDADIIVLYNNLLNIERRRKCFKNNNILSLQDIFTSIIENYSLLLKDQQLLKNVLAMLHHTIDLSKNEDKISEQCLKFLERMKTRLIDQEADGLYLEFIHQILQTFIQIGHALPNCSEISKDLINYVFSENDLIYARAVVCVRLFLEHFSCNNILPIMWERIALAENIKILAITFDFYLKCGTILDNIEFWRFLAKAVENADASNQKYALYILKMIINSFAKENRQLSNDVQEYFVWDVSQEESWSIYFTSFENMLEKQSHLILPSLELLKNIQVPDIWMNILLAEMLNHKNILVIKWSVKYILISKTVDTVNDKLLILLLSALNNTFLYTDAIPVKNFMSKNYLKFLNGMLNVDWKSVPLHYNLSALQLFDGNFESVDLESLTKLAVKIRKVQNKRIRYDIRQIYFKLFNRHIRKLCFNELLTIVDSLYNRQDVLNSEIEDILTESFSKLDYPQNIKLNIDLQFLKNRESLLLQHYKLFLNTDSDLTNLLVTLSSINNCQSVGNIIETKIANASNFNILVLNEINISDAENSELNFINLYIFLCSNSGESERIVIAQQSLALIKQQFDGVGKQMKIQCNYNIIKPIFVDKLTTMLIEMNLTHLLHENVESLIDLGGFKTYQNILFVLEGQHDEKVRSTLNRILMELKMLLKQQGFDGCQELCVSFIKFCNSSKLGDEYFEKFIDLDPTNTRFVSLFFTHVNCIITSYATKYLIFGLLFGEPLHGDEKVEYDYGNKLHRIHQSDTFEVRQLCFQILFDINFEADEGKHILLKLKNEILTMSIELNKKKPRYFDNSKQHRIKLRMVQAIAIIHYLMPEWDDRYLLSILDENNQNNVTYVNELIIAHSINEDQLMDVLLKLSSYKNNALPSIFAITYMACRKFHNYDIAMKSVELILPWTMAQHFSIRLNSQIVIFHILECFKESSNRFHYLREGIYASLQQGNVEQNLTRLRCDFRYNDLNYTHLLDPQNILLHIPKITNMATDELYREDMWLLPFNLERSSVKMKYSQHEKITKKKPVHDVAEELQSNNVQRKLNPIRMEVDPEFCFYSDTNNSGRQNSGDMIVVASLITKLPNLGGIARTCEVLGIKNLVLDSLNLSNTKEFQTLSMTAEKGLNIEEVKSRNLIKYLNYKKSEGYRILGAEQTANSDNFAKFKFPEKCVLLLGHEKDGIPANIIAMLDHAIEIPQFGMVRSLNVHVTGALFMWEYCKQYLAK